jgi:hypothetical protein
MQRIVIWNRLWAGNGLINHRLTILDSSRKVRWEHTGMDIPIPCVSYDFPFRPKRIQFNAVDTTYARQHLPNLPPNTHHLIDPPKNQGVTAWWVWDMPGKQQTVSFTLEPGQDLSGKLVAFRLGH